MPRGGDDHLSSLVGHGEPAEQQRERLQSSMRWHASRVFLLACAPVFVPVALLLWFTRQPGEWGDGWVPPALSLLISLLAVVRLVQLARAPRRQEQPAIALLMMALVMALPVVVAISRDLGLWSVGSR